jgi:hypothetical protein
MITPFPTREVVEGSMHGRIFKTMARNNVTKNNKTKAFDLRLAQFVVYQLREPTGYRKQFRVRGRQSNPRFS